MRVILMIPTAPPPTLSERERWSLSFSDFVAQCLHKARARTLLRWVVLLVSLMETSSNRKHTV